MDFKTGSKEIAEGDLVKEMESLGIKVPEALDFPYSKKLDEKFAVTFDRKGFVLRDGKFVPAYSSTITKNKVARLEKGE